MTYDAQAVLSGFHRKHGLGYPLLQDQQARHVLAYGVLNPEYEPGHAAYGVPLPGVLFIAPDGRVRAKFAVPGYRDRPDLADVYASLVGLLDEPRDG